MTRSKIIAALSAVALLTSAGTATAHKLITGADIRNGTVAERDLDSKVRGKLNRTGTPGKDGQQGPAGRDGSNGASGASGAAGAAGAAGSQGSKGDAGAKGEKGSDGFPGPQGPKGDTGPAGSDATVTFSESVSGINGGDIATASCGSGKVAISGEYVIDPKDATNVDVIRSTRGGVSGEQWTVQIRATTPDGSQAPTFTVQAICTANN